MKACRVEGCGRRVRKLALCFGHLRNGDTGQVAPRVSGSVRDEQGRKHCRTCDQWLPIESFTKDHRSRDGLRSMCLTCHRSKRRLAKFGVTADWFDRTFASQGRRCAICGSLGHRGRGWAIDHDHGCCPNGAQSCGRCIRGILCNPCNLALGLMADSASTLRSAADYLERMSIVRGV